MAFHRPRSRNHWPSLDEDISVEGLLAGRRSGESQQSSSARSRGVRRPGPTSASSRRRAERAAADTPLSAGGGPPWWASDPTALTRNLCRAYLNDWGPIHAAHPSPTGATVSYDRYGSGPPLVLVHGGFSDHRDELGVREAAARNSSSPSTPSPAAAGARRTRPRAQPGRRGPRCRGASCGSVGEPAFLLGHSYGAQAALAAAAKVPGSRAQAGALRAALAARPRAKRPWRGSRDWRGPGTGTVSR